MAKYIIKFEGENEFLSIDYPVDVSFEGLTYPSVQHAWMASKTPNISIRRLIQRAPEASYLPLLVCKVSPDWSIMQGVILIELLREKFSYPELAKQLIATGDAIIEAQEIENEYWGFVKGKNATTYEQPVGYNNYGKMLMGIRSELKDSAPLPPTNPIGSSAASTDEKKKLMIANQK